MILECNNCRIEFADNRIKCLYTYLGKKNTWVITLGEGLSCNEHVLIPDHIQEFQYEVIDTFSKSFVFQTAIIYYILKDDSNPIELCRLCVIDETKLTRETKSYQFATEILKGISSFYEIPFVFKHSVEKKDESLVAIFILLILIGFTLLACVIAF